MWLVALKIAGIIVVFHPLALSAFDLPKSLFSRGLEWWIGGVLVASLLRFGPSIVPRTRLHLAVGTLVAVNLLSTAFAEDRYTALYGEFGRYLGLTFLLDMVVLYLAISICVRRRADWLVLGAAIGLAAIAAAGYAVVQAMGLDPIPWGANARSRPFGTLGNPNMLAHVMVAVAAAAAAVAAFATRPSVRVGAALLVGAPLMAAVLSGTRTGAVGVGAAIVALAALRVRLGRLPLRQALLAALVIAAVAMLVLVATPFGARFDALSYSVRERLTLWDGALQAARDRPLLGWGPDSFGVAFAQYRAPTGDLELLSSPYNQAHDWVLETAATTGLAGVLALVVLNIAGARALLRRFDEGRGAERAPFAAALAALAAYWASGLILVSSVEADWIPWACLGAAATQQGARATLAARPLVRRSLQLAVLGVALVGPTTGIGALRAALEANTAINLSVVKPLEAFSAGTAATDQDPGRAYYWWIRGKIVQRIGLFRLAGDDYLLAAERYPSRSEYWTSVALARTYQAVAGDNSSGGPEAAIAAARRAIVANPYYSDPHDALAEVLSTFGEFPEALREIVRAIELYQRDGRYDRVAEEIADADPDKVEAGALLDRALRVKDTLPLRRAAAKAALARGDRDAARAHAARAVELDPADQDARRIFSETR
ncbi:MAG: O-antigen ligase family protein [Chloroflexi bacterium]|nr:O-antigen ligase family protein [Chloroflexota bacterium]